MTRIAAVVPTIGRESLARTILSALWADVVLVMWDGERREMELPRDVKIVHMVTGPFRNWGGGQRNLADEIAPRLGVTHLSFMDDDDVYAPEAGAVIRAAVEAQPDVMHVFCMQRRGGEVIGRHRKVECGFVGTPMMVVPVGAGGVWGDRYEGDCDFAVSTAARIGVVWHDDVVALIGEAGNGR